MRNAQHYTDLLDSNPNAVVDIGLSARAVYAARFGSAEVNDVDMDELKAIHRALRDKYGENLTPDQVKREMAQPATDRTKTCLKCGHVWQAIREHPRVCPACKRVDYEKPRVRNARPRKGGE